MYTFLTQGNSRTYRQQGIPTIVQVINHNYSHFISLDHNIKPMSDDTLKVSHTLNIPDTPQQTAFATIAELVIT